LRNLLNILIIDDDKDITNVLDIYLSQNNTTVVFNDPLEALEHYQENTIYDIITVDFFMPQLRGDKLVEKILKINPNQNLIACSGSPTAEFHRMIRKHKSLIQVITKPFIFSDFDDAIATITNKNP